MTQVPVSMFQKLKRRQRVSVFFTLIFAFVLGNTAIFQYALVNENSFLTYEADALLSNYEKNNSISKSFNWSLLYNESIYSDLNLYFDKTLVDYKKARLDVYTQRNTPFAYRGVESLIDQMIFSSSSAKSIHFYSPKNKVMVSYMRNGDKKARNNVKVPIGVNVFDTMATLISSDKSKTYMIYSDIKDQITYETVANVLIEHSYNPIDNDYSKLVMQDFRFKEEKSLPGLNEFKRGGTMDQVIVVGDIKPLGIINKYFWYFTAFTTLILVLGVIFIRNISKSILEYQKRMEHILEGISRIQGSDLHLEIPAEKNTEFDEIEQIRVYFNNMIGRVNDYINRSYKFQASQAESQFKLLQSQINPHFLYNTLEVIRMHAILDGNHELSDMVFSLSSLFRLSIEGGSDHSLEKEVEFLEQYLALYKLRYPENFEYKVNFDKSVESLPILKFILQPIIENSLIHGFDFSESDNFLGVNLDEIDGYLVIEIMDNGMGFDVGKEFSGDSMALQNIDRRLKLHYGKNASLYVMSDSRGTFVEIKIPINEMMKEDQEDV